RPGFGPAEETAGGAGESRGPAIAAEEVDGRERRQERSGNPPGRCVRRHARTWKPPVRRNARDRCTGAPVTEGDQRIDEPEIRGGNFGHPQPDHLVAVRTHVETAGAA